MGFSAPGTVSFANAAAPFFFAGELRSVVDRTYPLAEAAEAHRCLESRQQFGKIVLGV